MKTDAQKPDNVPGTSRYASPTTAKTCLFEAFAGYPELRDVTVAAEGCLGSRLILFVHILNERLSWVVDGMTYDQLCKQSAEIAVEVSRHVQRRAASPEPQPSGVDHRARALLAELQGTT